ncbi:MAG: SDR family oxidoreductase [Anaeromyxobacter sp.]
MSPSAPTTAGTAAQFPTLRDRVALVTGGATGIGACLVEAFARQGAKVAFLDVAREAGEALAARLAPGAAHAPRFLPCNLTDTAALQRAIAEIEAGLGPVRTLVNNAARDDRHKLEEVTPEGWDAGIAVNLKHQFFAAQAVAPGMARAGGGSIVNMSSIAWMIPSPDLHVYVTAKAALVGMTRSLAHALGGQGIRVNAVLPGAILTERQRRLWMTPDYEREVLSRQCVPRLLVPEDVAPLVLFLGAEDSAAMTNQTYVIDGGWI